MQRLFGSYFRLPSNFNKWEIEMRDEGLFEFFRVVFKEKCKSDSIIWDQ